MELEEANKLLVVESECEARVVVGILGRVGRGDGDGRGEGGGEQRWVIAI